MAEVLLVITSYDRLLNGDPTGLWLEEFAVPYNRLRAAGHTIQVVSVAGGDVAVDPASKPDDAQAGEWSQALEALRETASLADTSAEGFDAVYLPGGHGKVFDMPYNKQLQRLLQRMNERGALIASVCHGPGVFVGLRDANGAPWIAGLRVCAFSDAEEGAVGGRPKVPFLLESRLRELGAEVNVAEPWQPYVVRDGRLITGQNPQSSGPVADALSEALTERAAG